MNYLRTAILLAGLTALFMGVGYLIGGQSGAMIALAGRGRHEPLQPTGTPTGWCCRCTAPRRSTSAPRPTSCAWCASSRSRAGLPMPRVYLMDNPQPNAFATGRNPQNAAVAVTTGLLSTLSREEVAGVIAHELAHIKNRDTLIMTITATIAGAISMLAQFGMFFGGNRDNNNGLGIIGTLAMVILAPIAAMLVQMAISRTREYAADRTRRRHRRAAGLRSPRRWPKLERRARRSPNAAAERNPATAHMFIINPLSGHAAWTTCSRPIRRPRTASRRCSSSRGEMGRSAGGPTAGRQRPPGGPWSGRAHAAKARRAAPGATSSRAAPGADRPGA